MAKLKRVTTFFYQLGVISSMKLRKCPASKAAKDKQDQRLYVWHWQFTGMHKSCCQVGLGCLLALVLNLDSLETLLLQMILN